MSGCAGISVPVLGDAATSIRFPWNRIAGTELLLCGEGREGEVKN